MKIVSYVKHGFSLFLLIAAIWGVSGCKDSSPQYTVVTENDVRTLINEVERATLAKDPDGVIKHLAPFVIITVTLETSSGMQRLQLSRDQYKEELQKTFIKASRHEYKHENDQITVSDTGRSALVETDIIELLVIDGKEAQTITHEKTGIEIIDGKLLATFIDAYIVKK